MTAFDSSETDTHASATPTTVAAELRNVNKWYGDHHVLTDVSCGSGAVRSSP